MAVIGRVLAGVVFCALSAGVLARGLPEPQEPLRADGDSMERKLAAITARGEEASGRPLQTSFTDREVNAYFKFNGLAQLPSGVSDPHITFPAADRVDFRVTLDLDAVRESKPQGLIANALLRGSAAIHVIATVQTSKSTGQVHLESATWNGMTVPASLLDLMLGYYSKTPAMPDGFRLDKPFELPSKIRELQVRSGGATVIQ